MTGAVVPLPQVSSSQKSPVLSVACGTRADAFATCAKDGTMRVWDLGDFGVVAEASERPRGGVGGALCLCWLGEEAVVTGWRDCSVRCALLVQRAAPSIPSLVLFAL